MGHPEDRVLAFLEDTLARQVRVLRYLELLSQFIDDREALELALEIKSTALEQHTETVVWRQAQQRKRFAVPELAAEVCAHFNGGAE